MKDLNKFLNLGLTMVLIIVGGILIGKFTKHLVIGIFGGIICALLYLFKMALAK